METVFTTKELAERWKCHENAIRQKEFDGLLHRLKNLPGVKYSAKEVLQLEALPDNVLKRSAYEWECMEAENKSLRKRVRDLEDRMARIMITCQGGGVQ